MADGFVHLYQTGWSRVRAALRITSLGLAGAALANPATGKIHTGEWDDRDSQDFKYWLDADTDIFCTVRRVTPDVVVEEFSLDGFGGPWYEPRQDRVIHLILPQLRETGSSAVGLVADRRGSSLATDVDGIVLGGPTPVTVLPELLILEPGAADRRPEPADWGRRPGSGSNS
ncbi:hypothetical protein JOF41_001195 [Saccharothrix coeruleofusca]|uniref:hypothetical protein n=1 Tax=Saccharothrix coeruleofusca TaxID=33919 RepID=UPI001AE249D1|nr:hypothetical protein [Saccharothrix coeruleofusca]MBP2335017.1 hypothetical protein [Saccharothrix coeruleofusca]